MILLCPVQGPWASSFKDQWLDLLTNSKAFKANCSTRIVYMFNDSYIISVEVLKQLFKFKAYTVCL